jgi:hypothetical protein
LENAKNFHSRPQGSQENQKNKRTLLFETPCSYWWVGGGVGFYPLSSQTPNHVEVELGSDNLARIKTPNMSIFKYSKMH